MEHNKTTYELFITKAREEIAKAEESIANKKYNQAIKETTEASNILFSLVSPQANYMREKVQALYSIAINPPLNTDFKKELTINGTTIVAFAGKGSRYAVGIKGADNVYQVTHYHDEADATEEFDRRVGIMKSNPNYVWG